MSSENEQQNITLNEKSMEILIAKFIPTSQYFEARFDHLQYQVDEIKDSLKSIDRRFDLMQSDMDKRFNAMQSDIDKRFNAMQSDIDKRFNAMQSDMDKRFNAMQSDIDSRFEQVDKRFEQVDKRFEQVDKRFEQINEKLDKVLERIDVKIDNGLRENREFIKSIALEQNKSIENGQRENRNQSIRLFSFAMIFSAISMVGLLGKFANIF